MILCKSFETHTENFHLNTRGMHQITSTHAQGLLARDASEPHLPSHNLNTHTKQLLFARSFLFVIPCLDARLLTIGANQNALLYLCKHTQASKLPTVIGSFC